MNSVNSYNPQTATVLNNNNDRKKEYYKNLAISTTGTVVAWEAEPIIKKITRLPFSKYIKNNFTKINNVNYLPYIEKAISQNNLTNDFKMVNLNPVTLNSVKEKFNLNFENNLFQKTIRHILRLPSAEKALKDTANGQNAFFMPYRNAIFFNFEKFSAPAFHEIAHKLNSQSKNILVNCLSKVRSPLAFIGPLYISAKALTTNKNDSKNSKFSNFVKNNCGLLAFATVLPLTIEECIANFKGTKIAKNSGVSGQILNKIKLCHKMSIISYCSAAIATGISIHFANKIRDKICSFKKNIN